MNAIIFEIAQDPDGGFTAEAIRESLFTQTDAPASIRMRVVRDEAFAIA